MDQASQGSDHVGTLLFKTCFQNNVALISSAKQVDMSPNGGHHFLSGIMGLEILDARVLRIVGRHLTLGISQERIGRKRITITRNMAVKTTSTHYQSIDPSARLEFFMQRKYINAQSLPFNGFITLSISYKSIIIIVLGKDNPYENGECEYLWASRKKKSRFEEVKRLALRRRIWQHV